MENAQDCRVCGLNAYRYLVSNGSETCTNCGHTRIITNAWFANAACRGVSTSLFFLEKGDYVNVDLARSVCDACEVKEPCLRYALANHERFGVWGGKTPGERRLMQTANKTARKAVCEGCSTQFETTNRKRRWCSRNCYMRKHGHRYRKVQT